MSLVQVALSQCPTGESQAQRKPAPHSESRTQPYTHLAGVGGSPGGESVVQ